jgi:hypothetical protein
MANGSRFHIEINSIKVEEATVRFNIFGETLAEVVHDMEQVLAYVSGQADIPQGAPIPVIAPKAPPVPKPPAKAVGVCFKCGSDDLEWVSGTRKDNGKAFAAFRCQACKQWQPEVK